MKSNNYKIKILTVILVIIGLGFLLSGKVSAIEDWVSGSYNEPYERDSTEYCGEHGATLNPAHEDGSISNPVVHYEKSGDESMDIRVAYAIYLGVSPQELQNVIWAYTKHNKGSQENRGYSQKIDQYRNVHDSIFNNLKGKLLKSTTDANNLKVLVDRESKTYTVGPYSMSLNLENVNKDIQNDLLQELRSEYKDHWSFARFDSATGITGINGTILDVVDESGKSIPNRMPDFTTNQKFYIKFKPNDDGAIAEVGAPVFNISYLSNVTGSFSRYVESSITADLNMTFTKGAYNRSFAGSWQEFSKVLNSYVTVEKYIDTYEYTASNSFWFGTVEGAPKITRTQEYYIIRNSNGGVIQEYSYGTAPNTVTETVKGVKAIRATAIQDIIKINMQSEGALPDIAVTPEWKNDKIDLPNTPVNMQLGGKVWVDVMHGPKHEELNGKKDDDESPFAGIEVTLYESNGNPVATTTTDKNGVYRFYGKLNGKLLVNPLKTYYVVFRYNGQLYQATYYKDDLTGGYSNAMEVERDSYNNKFGTIDAYPNNYNGKIAYAWDQKLKNDKGEFIQYNSEDALRFKHAYEYFLKVATNSDFAEPNKNDATKNWNKGMDYEKAYTELRTWLSGKKVSETEINSVIEFIKDSLMSSSTHVEKVLYAKPNQFVLENIDKNSDEYKKPKTPSITLGSTKYTYLYSIHSDQARNVDFGLAERAKNNLAIQKDILKATVIVNGKKEEYIYNKKALDNDGVWTVNIRKSDENYSPSAVYNREVKNSDYLYNGEQDSAGQVTGKLKMYVTYRITIKNQGSYNAKVGKIFDYYNPDEYEYIAEDGIVKANTYRGIQNFGIGSDDLQKAIEGANTGALTISNVADSGVQAGNSKLSRLEISGLDKNIDSGNFTTLFVTFKAKNDPATNRIKIDSKHNIAEIANYSTYYTGNISIPTTLSNKKDDQGNYIPNAPIIPNKNTIAGVIDTDSNPGNLTSKDIGANGVIIHNPDKPWLDREEDDTDQAPTLQLKIDDDENHVRKIKGYVFEDSRTKEVHTAQIGDGSGEEETRINGVTLELVRLSPVLDENEIATGKYKGYVIDVPSTGNDTDYYSGKGTSKTVINDEKTESKFDVNNGEYEFRSIVAGDYFIRFKYGDTYRTVLTNDANSAVNTMIESHSNNAKSYNGQDYKSTVYQADVDQNKVNTYNGMEGYKNIETQNGVANNQNIQSDLASLYMYDIDLMDASPKGISDAKDIYAYRDGCINYSTTLKNDTAEKLAAFKELISNATKATQISAIQEMMNNTSMVAQTGIIKGEVERNRETTKYGDSLDYTIDDVDLGLTERPKTALTLNKEVRRLYLATYTGEIDFDTTESVSGVKFNKHGEHEVIFNNKLMTERKINSSAGNIPELIQIRHDDEMLNNKILHIEYSLKVENHSETDFTDKEFYYKGTESNPAGNIVKTKATQVIDYPSNVLSFDNNAEVNKGKWEVININNILTNDVKNNLVNKKYEEELKTYNKILLTKAMNKELTPEVYNNKDGFKSDVVALDLQTIIDSDQSSFVYNNLAEIVETQNSVGRRCEYSIVGNQPMADQSLGDNAATGALSPLNRVEPEEIDADSAQIVKIVPDTGSDINYLVLIAGIAIAVILMVSSGLVVRKGTIQCKKDE